MFYDLYYNGDKLRLRTGETLSSVFTSDKGMYGLRDGVYELEIEPTSAEVFLRTSDRILKNLLNGQKPTLTNTPSPLDTLTPFIRLDPTGHAEKKARGELYLHSTPPKHMKRGIRLSRPSFQRLKTYSKLRHKHTLTLCVKIGNQAAWMNTAWDEKGTKEIKGATHSARVLEYSAEDGFPMSTDDSNHPWCGAFIGWVMREHDIPTPHISVRSAEWRTYGRKINEPTYGCIGFKWRNRNRNLGHVTFIVGQNSKGDQLYGLGGNQNDEVNVMEFSKDVFDTFCVPSDYVNKHDWLPVYKGDFVKSGRQG